MNPVNLTIRFVLELWVLVAVAVFGWNHLDDPWRYVAVIGGPLVLIFVWGLFNVPDDPSRSGHAPVVVPGIVRLGIEIVYFVVGFLATYLGGMEVIAVIFGVVVVAHYLMSMDRVRWLLSR